MGFFDDDGFEDIVREFFGEGRTNNYSKRKNRETIIRGEEDERDIDFVEDKDRFYIIFELPGYTEKDIIVLVQGSVLEIRAKKKNGEEMQDYLSQKLQRGEIIRKEIPKFIKTKKFSYNMRNGVLEVTFNK